VEGERAIFLLLKGEVREVLAGGEKAIAPIIVATHSGMTNEEFAQIVRDWIATAKHPITKRLYTEMVYQPMLELVAHLKANGFKTFIVSGGGIEFMRPWTEKGLRRPARKRRRQQRQGRV
jgi:phosphoserine phosphatase